jgi:hypothetical protein
MAISETSKEVLFVLGEFFKATDRRFSSAPLEVGVSKAEFIDAIMKTGAVKKQERALYKNLEELQNYRYILYRKDKILRMSNRGLELYRRMSRDLERLMDMRIKMATTSVGFKRKIQAKLVP